METLKEYIDKNDCPQCKIMKEVTGKDCRAENVSCTCDCHDKRLEPEPNQDDLRWAKK